MASRKKTFDPKGRGKDRVNLYAAFIADLLDGTIEAVKLTEVDKGRGRKSLDYEEPDR